MNKMFLKPFVKDVILAVSGSTASMQTAKYAIMFAKQNKCRLKAVYVADTAALEFLLAEKIFVEHESKEWEAELINQGKRCLSFVQELARAKGVKISVELRKGEIAQELIKAAAEKNAGLIVLCGQGDEKCSDCPVVHTRYRIQRDAKCSVLFVNDVNIDKIYRKKK